MAHLAYQPTAEEARFVQETADPALARAGIAFAVAYNRLDVAHLADKVAEDIVYGSQKVWEELTGKSEVLGYISEKFDTVRRGGHSCQVRAELGFSPSNGSPCVLLHQRSSKYQEGLGDLTAYADLKVNEVGQITKIFLVSLVPSPADCTRTGLFPGFSAEQIERDKSTPRLVLPKDTEITFKLFVLPGSGVCRAMQESVERLVQSESSWSLQVLDALSTEVADGPVTSFPTLVVEYGDNKVLTIEGYHDVVALSERLNAVMS